MQLAIIQDIERLRGQRLTIGQKQQIVTAINLYREGIRNADSNMMQIISRKLSIMQNEFIDPNTVERKAAEYLKRPLTTQETTFIRQTDSIRRSSLVQIQTTFVNKMQTLSRLSYVEVEVLLKKHKLFLTLF